MDAVDGMQNLLQNKSFETVMLACVSLCRFLVCANIRNGMLWKVINWKYCHQIGVQYKWLDNVAATAHKLIFIKYNLLVDAISIQARQFTTSIWIHHTNVCLSVLIMFLYQVNKQTNVRIDLKKNWKVTTILRITWNVGMPSKEHAHTHSYNDWLPYTHLLGFSFFIKINRDICNCCEWQTINHLLPRSLHATRSRSFADLLVCLVAAPTWSELVRFILLVWLAPLAGWLPGL